MASRADILKKSRQAKLRRKVRFYGLVLFFVLVVFGILVYLIHLPVLRLQKVVVIGAEKTESVEVKLAVEQFLFAPGFSFWPKDNRWFYRRDELIAGLQKKFSRLQTVELKRNGGQLTISLSEYEASLLWCRLIADQAEDCYFLNDEGKILAKAPVFADPVFFEVEQKVNTAASTSAEMIGQMVMPADEVESLLSLREAINNLFDKTVLVRSIINKASIEDYGYNFTIDSPVGEQSHSWSLLVMFGENPERLTETLIAVLNSPGFKEKTAGQIAKLEYVDVRLPGKVFYKLTEDHASLSP